DQDTTFSYDAFGRMIKSRGPGDSADRDYTYDGLDRRDTRIDNKGQPTQQTLDYSYIGLTEKLSREELPALDSDTTGATKTVKTYDYDSRLSRQGQQSNTGALPPTPYRSYGTDANGSIEGLEDPTSGAIKNCDGHPNPACKSDRYRYDPYGELQDNETSLTDE